jgi:hypothetical protein
VYYAGATGRKEKRMGKPYKYNMIFSEKATMSN